MTPYTGSLVWALRLAQEEALQLPVRYIGSDQLLLGILLQPDCLGALILERLGVKAARLVQEIKRGVFPDLPQLCADPEYSIAARQVLEQAKEEAGLLQDGHLGTEHLLLGLVKYCQGRAGRLLAQAGVTLAQVRQAVEAVTAEVRASIAQRENQPDSLALILRCLPDGLRQELTQPVPIGQLPLSFVRQVEQLICSSLRHGQDQLVVLEAGANPDLQQYRLTFSLSGGSLTLECTG